MLKKLLKKEEGFTLVELLAVIVILAIIAAIAIPAIGHIINNSRNKSEANDALQIIDAAKMYMSDANVDTTTSSTTNGVTVVAATTSTNGSVTIPSAALTSYLNGTHSSFTDVKVTISSGSSTGDTYTIDGHTDPVSAAHTSTGATEDQLLSYLKTGVIS